MRIKMQSRPKIKFGEIECGQTFIYQGELFIKIEDNLHDNDGEAVELSSGELYDFCFNTLMELVDGMFVEGAQEND